MSGEDTNQQQPWTAMQQYPQWWMAAPYPAMPMQYPAMPMQYPATHIQQMMMYNQHYYPYYHQQQQPNYQLPRHRNQIHTSGEDNKTIWIGDLRPWMDEDYVRSCFSQSGEVLSVKVIRNRQTNQSDRYGFIKFSTHDAAENALQSYNGTVMPDTDQTFRLNWASFSTGDRRPEAGSNLSIFVGDLAPDVTDELLHDTFSSKYPSIKDVKVVVDPNTGRSKGYGFVRFTDESEKSRAVTEMNGVLCSSKPMRIGNATPKRYSSQRQGQSESESSSTTIFVGRLDPEVTADELREPFIHFGEVVSVKIPVGKGCGFVEFAGRSSAEDAINRLNGEVIGKQKVRLSWGRAHNQLRGDSNNWNGGYYPRPSENNGGAAYWAASPMGAGASSSQ